LLNGKDWILLYYTFFYLIGKHNLSYPNLSKDIIDHIYNKNNLFLEKIDLDKLKYKETRDYQDYVFDKHTRQWKSLGRWKKHFFEQGAILNNKKIIFNDYYSNWIDVFIKNI
jgi:hypothetical protein